jgi:hypothetical protein
MYLNCAIKILINSAKETIRRQSKYCRKANFVLSYFIFKLIQKYMRSFNKFFISGLAIAFMLASCSVSKKAADKNTKSVTINYSFDNIVDGYDHISILAVYIDGVKVAVSDAQAESIPGTITVPISRGEHTIKAVSLAQYEGEWEEHTIENEYSIDCLLEKNISVDKDIKITIVFDLDSGTIEK